MVKQTLPVMALTLAMTVMMTVGALAAESEIIATHGKWTVFRVKETGAKVCYMASEPAKDEGDYTRRGPIHALVTNRPAEGTRNVFSYIAGYPYKPGSDATVKIGNSSFTLFTQDDTAWAPDAATDEKLIEAIRKGATMVVRGVSSRGTATVDTFDLKGSGAAHDAMTKECAGK